MESDTASYVTQPHTIQGIVISNAQDAAFQIILKEIVCIKRNKKRSWQMSQRKKPKTCCESEDVWYINSGCSNHMTSNLNNFVEIDINISTEAKLGDENMQKVVLTTKLYVPNLAQNLFSVEQLIQKGCQFI